MKTHFNLVSGAAIVIAASFTVGLFGCSAENSMDSLRCFSQKCTTNDYDDDYDNKSSSSNRKNSSSSNKGNTPISVEVPSACDYYINSLLDAPRCYPRNFGETMYVEDAGMIFSCEPNMFTEEGYWATNPNITDCDEYVPSFSTSSSSEEEEDIYPSSSSLDNDIPIEHAILIDYRDNNIYQTITIGNQTWMAENLRFRYLQETDELDSSSFCYSNDGGITYDCDKYGRYYLWSAAMDSAGMLSEDGLGCGNGVICEPNYPVQGICPDGWHLPSEEEMEWLINYTMSQSIGTDLRSEYGWEIPGTNLYGFNALASGLWIPDASDYPEGFYLEGYLTNFWTSTQNSYDGEVVPVLYLQLDEDDLSEYSGVDDERKWRGYPIRCVQN